MVQCSCNVEIFSRVAVFVDRFDGEVEAILFFPRFIRDRAANDICRWNGSSAVETDC